MDAISFMPLVVLISKLTARCVLSHSASCPTHLQATCPTHLSALPGASRPSHCRRIWAFEALPVHMAYGCQGTPPSHVSVHTRRHDTDSAVLVIARPLMSIRVTASASLSPSESLPVLASLRFIASTGLAPSHCQCFMSRALSPTQFPCPVFRIIHPAPSSHCFIHCQCQYVAFLRAIARARISPFQTSLPSSHLPPRLYE